MREINSVSKRQSPIFQLIRWSCLVGGVRSYEQWEGGILRLVNALNEILVK